MSLFPGSNPLRSNWSVLNVVNGGPRNPKLTQSKWPVDKNQSFQNLKKKKEALFFNHRGTK